MVANIKIESYSPHVYSNLPDFLQAKEMLSHCDGSIRRLGDVIRRHNMNSYCGVSLLHKHFNLHLDELLLRSMHENVMHVTPSRRGKAKSHPFVWAFAKTKIDHAYRLFPVEFIAASSSPKWIEKANAAIRANQSFLVEYFSLLCDVGLSSYFGLGLLPRRLFTMRDSDTLMENDNFKRRILTIEVVPVSDLENVESTQTLWFF